VVALRNVPAGIGSGVEWDRRWTDVSARPSLPFPVSREWRSATVSPPPERRASVVHDEIIVRDGRWGALSNRAGGIEEA
jgi:chorismate synthase